MQRTINDRDGILTQAFQSQLSVTVHYIALSVKGTTGNKIM
jgi:hypothetical protein